MAATVAMPSFIVPLLSALAFLLVLGVSWLAYGCCTRKPRITRALDTQGRLIQKNNTSLYNSNNKHNTLQAGPEYPKSVFGHSYESLSDISDDGIPNPYINDDGAVYENQSNRGQLDLSFRFPPSRRPQPQTHETTSYYPPPSTTPLSPLDTLSPPAQRPSPSGSTYFPRSRTGTRNHSEPGSKRTRNQRQNGYTTIQDQDQTVGREPGSRSKPTPKPIPVPTPTPTPARSNKKSWWSWFGLRGRDGRRFKAGDEYTSEGTTAMVTPGKVGIAEKGMGWSRGKNEDEEETRLSGSRSRSRSQVLKTPTSASSHSVFYSASSSFASAVPHPKHTDPSLRTPRASESHSTPSTIHDHNHASTLIRTPTSGLAKRRGHVSALSNLDLAFELVQSDVLDSRSDQNSETSLPSPKPNSRNFDYDPHPRQHHRPQRRKGQSYVMVQRTPQFDAVDTHGSNIPHREQRRTTKQEVQGHAQGRSHDCVRDSDSLSDPQRMLGPVRDVNGTMELRDMGGSANHDGGGMNQQQRGGQGSMSPRPRWRRHGKDVHDADEERFFLPSPPPLANSNSKPFAKRRIKNAHSRSDATVQGIPATILLHAKSKSPGRVKGQETPTSKASKGLLHHSRAMRITRRYTQPTFTERTSGLGIGVEGGDDDEDEDGDGDQTQHRQRLDFKRAQTDPTPFSIAASSSPARSRSRSRSRNRNKKRSRSRGLFSFASRSRGDDSDDEEYEDLSTSPTGTPTRASWERTVEWMNMGSSGGAGGPTTTTRRDGRARGRVGDGASVNAPGYTRVPGPPFNSGLGTDADVRTPVRGVGNTIEGSKSRSASGSEIMELEATGVLSARFITRSTRRVVEEAGDLGGGEPEDEDGWTDTSLSMVMAGRDQDRKLLRGDDTTFTPGSFEPSSRSHHGSETRRRPHPRTAITFPTAASSSNNSIHRYTSTPIQEQKQTRNRSSPSLAAPRGPSAVAATMPSSDLILNLVDKIMLWDGTSLEFPDD